MAVSSYNPFSYNRDPRYSKSSGEFSGSRPRTLDMSGLRTSTSGLSTGSLEKGLNVGDTASGITARSLLPVTTMQTVESTGRTGGPHDPNYDPNAVNGSTNANASWQPTTDTSGSANYPTWSTDPNTPPPSQGENVNPLPAPGDGAPISQLPQIPPEELIGSPGVGGGQGSGGDNVSNSFKDAIDALAGEYGIDPALISFQDPYSDITPSDASMDFINKTYGDIEYASNEDDIRALYDDMMSKLDEDWDAKRNVVMDDAAFGSRLAASANAASGRSLGGGFLAGQRQADIAGRQQMARADLDHRELMRDILGKQVGALIDEKRLASTYGIETDRARADAAMGLASAGADARANYYSDVMGHIFGREEAEVLATLDAEGAAAAGGGGANLVDADDETQNLFGGDGVKKDEETGEHYLFGSEYPVSQETIDSFSGSKYSTDTASFVLEERKAPSNTPFGDLGSRGWRSPRKASDPAVFDENFTQLKIPGKAFASWSDDFAKDHDGRSPTESEMQEGFLDNKEERRKYEVGALKEEFERLWLEKLQENEEYGHKNTGNPDLEIEARNRANESVEDFFNWVDGNQEMFRFPPKSEEDLIVR